MKKHITIYSKLAIAFMLLLSNSAISQTASWNYTLSGSNCTAISMTGATQIVLNSGNNDDGGALAAWPFPFYVYSTGYGLSNNLTMNTNGYMRFDASITLANNMPIPSNTFGQFLSYGGNTDGTVVGNIMQKVSGSSPNRIWTIALTYNTNYLGSTWGYQADIQVSFYETTNEIRIGFYNVTAGSSSATNLGINAGDNIYYNVIPTFPTSDTCYTFTPSTVPAVTDPTNFTQSVISTSQINLGWTKNANSNDVIVVYNTVNNFASPANGMSYAVGNQISPGQGTVLYKGSLVNYSHTGLTPNTKYYYTIYSYNNIPIYSPGVLDSATTQSILDPTNFNATTISSSQIDLSWVKNTNNHDVMIAYNTSNTFATPINGITYPVNNQIAAGQGTVIYSGSGTSFSHMSLPSGTHYYKAWSYDGSHYYSLGVIANATTSSVNDPSNLTTNALSTSQINLSWNKNTSNQDVMVVRHTNSTFPIPTNGYTYWVGAMLSANLEQVVYMGSATSFTDTGLTTSTNYCYKVFSYDANHYYSSGITACDTTMSPGLISFPYIQDFETTVAVGGTPVCNATHFLNIDWINSTTDDIDWVPRTGGTPSANTGPNGDHTSGSGNYLYTEASGGCYNYNADLISPLLNFVNLSNPTMEIFYHMYGVNMGTLSVQVSTNGGTSWSGNIWSQTGQQNTTQGSAYNQAQISLATYAGLGNIKIRIRGTTGLNYASDMAIDDIRIYQSVPMTYSSSTCLQNTEAVFHGVAEQEIMQIQIVTNGDQNPLTATQFMISTAGTTSLGDIANIKLWYTGASSTFATTNQFGSMVIIPSASFPISGSQVLLQDTNYFWLTYDIPTSANYNGVVDACCTQITISSSNKIPTVTCPIGDKSIKGYLIIGTGTSTDNTMPIHYDLNAASEFIYTSAEMGTAKDIAKLAFYKGSGNNTTQQPQNVSIYMKNSTTSTLATGSYSLSGYTLVYSSAPFPNNATSGWMEVSLITPFTYDGTSNLQVLVSQTVGPNFQPFQAPSWRYSTVTGSNRCRFANSATVAPGSLSLASSNRLPNIRFEYQLPTLMEYVSSTAVHPDTNGVSPGTTNEKILQIEVVTTNSINPLKVKGLNLTTTGTTSLSDIQNAKIYFTGANNTFSSSNQFAGTIASPGATLTFTNDSVTLAQGSNYFWLTYDVKSTATLNNYIDAQCTSIIVDDTARTPTVTSPVGKKQIRNFVIVGTGTLANTGTQDGSPYANYYWGAKNQYLITAADLISAGVGTGAINSLAFDVTNVNACPALDNFTIKLKNTTSTALTTSWETGVTTVYTISSYQPVLGWNTHAFSTPFIWDGVSNILVETCFNNTSYVNNGNASVSQTNTSSTATHYYRFDNSNVCSSVANSGTSNRKPNIKFDCALPTPMSYVSSKAFHSDTTGVLQGGSNQEIIGIEVVMTGNATPLSATAFSISTNGTTSLSDISNARLWFTGLDSNFSAINQFGSTVAAPASTNNFVGTQALANGKNYFWLTYNISSTATLGNYVDAECTSINVGGVKTPTVTAPFGKRMIAGSLSGTYTIGTGGDYPTFSAAANALNTFGISGAVTFNVFSGTYTEQIILNAISGTSSTNTITFQSQSGDSTNVILQFASNATNNFVLILDGTDYCTFKNMTIKSIGTTYGTVVELTNNSDFNTFTNNQIISIANAAANGAGIYSYGAGGANDNHITNNYINVLGDYGIHMRGSGTTTLQAGTEIENNVIMHGRYGVYAYYQNAVKINSNIISQPISPSSGYYYGIYLYYCDNSCEITKNKIDVKGVNSYIYGIFLGNSDGTATNRALVANNFVSVNVGGYPRGIYVITSNYINIFNNNINLTTGGNNGRSIYLPSGGNIILTNNNSINLGGGYAIYTNTGILSASDYNNLYTSGGTLAYWGQNRNTLAQWQSASSMDANSISVNPSYYSTTDLHVTNFAMDKLGTPITVITDDIDGEARHATTPDIGADEFQANYEISAEGFISPNTTLCGGNESVQIIVKNNGAITITSFSVNWSVNSVGQIPNSWTGSLASNDSVLITLGNYNFTAGSYTILAQTLSPNGQNDQVQSNDTVSLNIISHGYPTANAGTDTSICSTSTHTITSATAIGYSSLLWTTSGSGSFTNGTTINPTYTPSNADTASGMVYLTLTANGYPTCGTDTNSMALTLLNSPNATISGLASNYCQNNGTDTLFGSPAGGTFIGIGMSGNIFNPSVAGAGTHSITYLVTNSSGCSGNTSQQTNVYPLTTVSITGINTSYCINASTVSLTLTPFGGTLSGNGIVGTTFIPSVAGVGTHTITYSYTDANSCAYVVTKNVTVYALPTVSFTGLAASYCMSASPVTLTGSPAGGTFSGAGISGNTFNPANANAGTHSITYTYQDANSCMNSFSQNVTVNANPSVSFSGLQTSYCVNAGIVSLTGTPSGGSFSGTGMTGGAFNPAVAGTGTHAITYSYTNANGCSGTDIQNVTVYALPVANAGSYDSVAYLGTYNLSGSASGGTSNYTYSWVSNPPGFISSLQNPTTDTMFVTTIFTLTVIDAVSGCQDTAQVTIKVYGGPLSANAIAVPDSICLGDTTQLNALASGGTGSYSYTWASNPPGFSSTIANPIVNPTATTTYTVTVTSGTQSFNSSVTIAVVQIPTVSFSGLATSYCANDMSSTLVGIPSGGYFIGNGVTGSTFDPMVAGVGTHSISYTYANPFGCSAMTAQNTTVNALPTVSISGPDSVFYNTNTVLNGSASGGSSNYSYSWSPASLINGSTTQQNCTTIAITNQIILTLTVTDNVTACIATSVDTIFPYGGPLSAMASATPDTICQGTISQLNISALGGSGTYTYSWSSNPVGFSSTSQNPVVAPIITTTYTASISDGLSVPVISTVVVNVIPAPTVSFSGLSAIYCTSMPAVTLTGIPAGGTFTGPGITGTSFDPAAAGQGNHTITYTYTDGFGCSGVDMQGVSVTSAPIASAGNDFTFPCGAPGQPIGSSTVWGMVYSWSPTIGLSNPNISNPIASPSLTTVYTLTVLDTVSGCFATDDILINVSGGPTAVASPDTTICYGSAIILMASGGTSYMWSTNDTTSSIVVTPTVSTSYIVTVYDANSCADSDTINVTVNKPTVNLGNDTVVPVGQSLVLDAGPGFASYLWSNSLTSQTITVTAAGTYSVTVTDNLGCTGTDAIIVTFNIGLNEINTNINLSLFPNPTKGLLTIKIADYSGSNLNYEITDITGRFIMGEKLKIINNKAIKELDLSSYPKGVYLIKFQNDNLNKTEKIIIQ